MSQKYSGNGLMTLFHLINQPAARIQSFRDTNSLSRQALPFRELPFRFRDSIPPSTCSLTAFNLRFPARGTFPVLLRHTFAVTFAVTFANVIC